MTAVTEEQRAREQRERTPPDKHALRGWIHRFALACANRGIPRASRRNVPPMNECVHFFFFSCSSKKARVCSKLLVIFSPRQPCPSPSRISSLAGTPAALS